MLVISIFAIVGVIAVVGTLLFVVTSATAKKPEIPNDLFGICRGDLRELQDWYFSQRRYEDTEKVSRMLKELDGIWAAYDMENLASPVDNDN